MKTKIIVALSILTLWLLAAAAQVAMPPTVSPVFFVKSGAAASTWSSTLSDTSPGECCSTGGAKFTLSNGNLDEIPIANGAAWFTITSTSSHSTGKLYAEMVVVSIDTIAAGRIIFGVTASGMTLNDFLSDNGNSGGDQDSSGFIAGGAITASGGDAPNFNVANTVVTLKVDLTGGTVVAGICSGGTITPTGGSGSWTPPLTLFLAASGFADAGPAKIRLHTNSASQSCAAPATFTAWDGF
jgi:hypothetical protein